MPTLNARRTLAESLQAIINQDYPKELIEVLIVDGGSTDGTIEVVRSFGATVIDGGYRNNMEPRRGVGLLRSKNEIVAYIDSDNILPNRNYFKEMIQPFVDFPEVIGAQTWRFGLKPGFSPFNRYCALVGNNDPVPFYLGKTEKISYLDDEWKSSPIVEDRSAYFLVDFTLENLPTVGTNGFFVRREMLLKSHCSPDEFFHIDVISDLVAKGYRRFAMVRNEIYHDTAYQLRNLALKRMRYFLLHSPSFSARRYFVFDVHKKKDVIGIIIFFLCTITLVQPIWLSVRGYLKKKDAAWFLHPFVCLSFLAAYGVSSSILMYRTLKYRISLKFKN
ncbi:MAG: glycosyltransferase family 2 protein [Patescibacteria group bacterium]|nr:glycosyltransferase family 2 protein [Patescibacteria group bacterium]